MRWQDRIPLSWRLRIQLLRRSIQDSQQSYVFAKRAEVSSPNFEFKIELSQTIKPSHLFENKLHNINLASQRINQIIILPGEVFSFWGAVGWPNQKNGFKAGRNLVRGDLVEGFGGGLCQLSGLIYHLSLLASLTLVERHAHSVDIYREEERYTPLGADATVVYGYRDLRIKNDYATPIKFKIKQTPKEINGQLLSRELIQQREIQFVRKSIGGKEQVETYESLKGIRKSLHTVSYKKRY